MDKKTYIAFDQYQRYQTISNVIEFYRKENPNSVFSVLEIGSNEHKDLKLFLPKDNILFTDITLTDAMKQDIEFKQADGTNLSFTDNSFDFVVASDVLEHVPSEKRKFFCHELERVSKIASIICFPYNTDEIVDAEERLNIYYKSLYGYDFIWLKEHSECGLPNIKDIDQIYNQLSSQYTRFFHGNLLTWEKMWYCHFDTCGAIGTEEYRHTIDHYYNTTIYPSDIKEPCYRVFYVSAKKNILDLKKYINNKWVKSQESFEALNVFLNSHKNMVHQSVCTTKSEQNDFTSTIYWATLEQDMCEEQKVIWEGKLSDGDIRLKASLPQNIIALRFDPMEMPCIVEDLHIYSDKGVLKVAVENGIEYKGKYVFLENDPRFQIILDGKKVATIDLRARVTPLDFPEQKEILSLLFDSEKQLKQNQLQLLQEMEQNKIAYEEEIAQNKAAYEEEIAQNKAAYEEEINKKQNEYCELLAKQKELQSSLDHYMMHYHAVIGQREDLKQQLSQVQNAYNVISNAFFWKITKPARVFVDCIKKPFRKSHSALLAYKGIKCLKENGFKYTYNKVQDKLKHRQDYISLAQKPLFTKKELEAQRNFQFSKNIKFSIVVPLYNTPPKFLHEMIQSVIDQTYENWELCMADGSDISNKATKQICNKYIKEDKRIKYKRLNNNGGISKNTIEAYDLATGNYIVLMDHDDILAENALFECAKCIENNPTVDFIYSDKAIFEDKTNRILAYHYLPDYSPEFLRATNYASHLNLFSKYIIEEVGFIRDGYDGSQDYDLELRVAEKARSIKHISKVLYYCRACEGSVALNPESKMYAYEAGRKAIEEHITRIGYPGKVEFLKETFSYRIKYDIIKPAKVSIIIPNKDHVSDLETCIESILQKTNYENYEIIVVENNSVKAETFAYYQEIEKNIRIKVLYYKATTHEFNYSAINNYAVSQLNSKYILFLNNDTEVIRGSWLIEMLMYAQRNDVGAVGAKLYYPDDTYQHIGLFIGLGDHIATHYAHRSGKDNTGYMHRLAMPQNYNAVTAACLLIKREDFLAVQGFDEENFKVALNDVDLCLKLRKLGKYNVLTPYAELYHYESISRKSDDIGENKVRFMREQEAFRKKWSTYFETCDEYYNPNLHI